MVKTALKNREIDKMAPLDDKESQQVLSTLIKQRKDSVEQFTKGGRQEMADKEAAEITLIETYLPKAAGEEEIVAGVRAAIAEMGSPHYKRHGRGDEGYDGALCGGGHAGGWEGGKRGGEEGIGGEVGPRRDSRPRLSEQRRNCMRRVRYRVAMSLDGFIAGPKGEYDWIVMDPEVDFGAIMNQFDTLLVGRQTFQVMEAADKTTMPGMRTYVFSRTLQQNDYPKVTIIDEKAEETVSRLKKSPGKDIWLFGGGSLFRSLADLGLVDTVELVLSPVLLRAGIPLAPGSSQIKLALTKHKVYKSGIVSLEYAVR